MTERTLQEEAAELLVKPPAGGVWLDKDEVEKVLRALEEVTAATTGQVVDTQFWRERALEAETRLDTLRALLDGTFPGGPTPHADVPPSVIAPEGTAGDVSPEEEHEVGELNDGNATIVGRPAEWHQLIETIDKQNRELGGILKDEPWKENSHEGSGAPGNEVVGAEGAASSNTGGNPGSSDGAMAEGPQGSAHEPAEDRQVVPDGQRGSGEGGPPTPPAAAKTKCARCGGPTKRWCSDDAPPPFVDYRGKPICTPCVEALLPRCRGKNLAAGVACTSPSREGKDFCGRHLGQERSPVL